MLRANLPVSANLPAADARASCAWMLAINQDLDEAKNARNDLAQIDQILPRLGCRA